MDILYKPSFVRDFKKLPTSIQTEAKEKIELLRDPANHQSLRAHKLKGKLKQFYSFSITYKHRVVFAYEGNQAMVLIAIGTHDIYQ